MPLNKLRREFEDRRLNLIETLQRGKSEMELSKQHQLYGAIKEIEKFLDSIEYHQEETVNATDFELKREGPRPLSTRATIALQQVGSKTKGRISNLILSFQEKVIKGTGRVIKRTKRRIHLYKEVSRQIREEERLCSK